MSKLIKKPINTQGIQVEKKENILFLCSNLGKSFFIIPYGVQIDYKNDLIQITGTDSCICGSAKSNLLNIIKGLKEMFKVILKLSGVGYKVGIANNEIILDVGYSHDLKVSIPKSIFATIPQGTSRILELTSIDKMLVTTFAGKLCKMKKYNPYKQHGILWEGKQYLVKQPRAKR